MKILQPDYILMFCHILIILCSTLEIIFISSENKYQIIGYSWQLFWEINDDDEIGRTEGGGSPEHPYTWWHHIWTAPNNKLG